MEFRSIFAPPNDSNVSRRCIGERIGSLSSTYVILGPRVTPRRSVGTAPLRGGNFASSSVISTWAAVAGIAINETPAVMTTAKFTNQLGTTFLRYPVRG